MMASEQSAMEEQSDRASAEDPAVDSREAGGAESADGEELRSPPSKKKKAPSSFDTMGHNKQKALQRMLFEAAHYGYPTAVSQLLEAGVPVDQQDSTDEYKDYTALLYACAAPPDATNSDDRERVVELLLERKPALSKRNKQRMTALYMACFHGYLELVKLLVAHCDSTRAVEVSSACAGETLMRDEDRIQMARDKASTESDDLRKLLNAKTKESWTPVMAALKHGHMDVVRYLLLFKETDVCHRNREGHTLVHLAVQAGRQDFIELFASVKDMQPLFDKSDKKGRNVLHHCCAIKADREDSGSVTRLFTWLLERFPDLRAGLNKQDCNGYTPLHVACIYHNWQCVQYLLNPLKVDPKLTTKDGLTPLHCAAMHNDTRIVAALINAGCPLLAQDKKYGNTALHIAYKKDNDHVEELLRERGGDALVVIRNKDDKTAVEMELDEVIPVEIRKRGPKARRLYREALRETHDSKQRVPRCKLMVVGEERVGKTSLLRALTDEEFIDTPSTEGIDTSLVQTKVVLVDSGSPETWNVIEEGEDYSQFNAVAAAAICEKVAPNEIGQAKKSTKKPPHFAGYSSEEGMIQKIGEVLLVTSKPKRSHRKPGRVHTSSTVRHPVAGVPSVATIMSSPPPSLPTHRQERGGSQPFVSSQVERRPQPMPVSVQYRGPQPTHNDSDESLTPSMDSLSFGSRRVSQSIDAHIKANRTNPELRLVAYDFAGQVLYRPMHHCFITHRAIYIVAFKLNELVNSDKKESCYREMAFWLNTIHAHVSKTSQKECPPIYLVGTHRNTQNDEGKQANLEEVNDDLDKQFLQNERFTDHIQPVDGEVFVAVENSKPRREGGAEKLQSAILAKANELPFIKDERRPLKWLKFEEELFKMRKRVPHDKLGIVKREALKTQAQKCGIVDPETIDLALGFFHDLGTIVDPASLPCLFLDEEQRRVLSSVILLDPQHLANAMKVLMKLNLRQPCPKGVQRSDVLEVQKSGIASKAFLRACWADLLPENDAESFVHLCLFLQAFCLIIPSTCLHDVPGSSDEYLIPSQLERDPLECPTVFKREKCTRFYFDFCGYLPIELFHRVIYRFLLTQRCKGELHHGHCQLTDASGTEWWFEVLEKEQRLKVLTIVSQPERAHAVEAIHTVHSLLATVCENSGLQGMEYTGGPLCPHCSRVLPVLEYGKDGKKAHDISEKIPCKNKLCKMRSDAKLLLEVVTSNHDTATHPSLDEALSGMQAEILDQQCSKDALNKISKSLTHWPDVSPFLGLMEADEEDVRAKSDRAVSGMTRERVDVLRRWQQNQKERATYRSLAEAFYHAQRLDLVDVVIQLLQRPARPTPPTSSGSVLQRC